MARKFIFSNDSYYHVFNRGVEKRVTFTDRREYIRARKTLEYYRFVNLPFKFSTFINTEVSQRHEILTELKSSSLHAEILAYCFMPNHFHLLLRQANTGGISKFLAKFTNSYTKYFNTRHERVGPLFQGLFKAVQIETDEQLLQVTRYIHLNPVKANLVHVGNLHLYEWSSYSSYIQTATSDAINSKIILDYFKDIQDFQQFIADINDYEQSIETISHIVEE